MEKNCNKCGVSKSIDCFYKAKTSRDGHHPTCKTCHNLRSKERYFENYDIRRDQLRTYYYNNHEKEKASRRKHYKNNKETYILNSNLREAHIKIATPTWLSDVEIELMRSIYRECSELTIRTGVQHHVDHIVPLRGKLVCGLNVPWNLQILTAKENLEKSNKYE